MSLRRTLITGFSLLLTLVGAVAALYSYISVRNEAWGILDLQQRQIARFIGDGSGVNPGTTLLPTHEDDEDFVVQLLYADGRPSKISDPAVSFPAAIVPGMSDFTDESGPWRLFTLVDGPRTVGLGREPQNVTSWPPVQPGIHPCPSSLQSRCRGSWSTSWLAPSCAVLMPSPGGGQPVTRQSESRGRERYPEEVKPLLAAMNQAFGGLGDALKQQRQFVADAAHELRTPLAAVSLQISNIEHANGTRHCVSPSSRWRMVCGALPA